MEGSSRAMLANARASCFQHIVFFCWRTVYRLYTCIVHGGGVNGILTISTGCWVVNAWACPARHETAAAERTCSRHNSTSVTVGLYTLC